jgi:hypothetical protein
MGSWNNAWWNSISITFVHSIPFTIKPSSFFSMWVASEAFMPAFHENELKRRIWGKEEQ